MVDLPVPAPELVTSRAPQQMVTAADVARSGGYIATGIDKLGQGLAARGAGLEQFGRGVQQEGEGVRQEGEGFKEEGQLEQVKAAGEEKLGEGFGDLSVPLAETAARGAIKANPDGSISAAPSLIFGKGGEAYAATEQAAMGPMVRSKIDSDMVNLRTQYQDDPQGFQKASQHLIAGYGQTIGNNPVGQMAVGYGQQVASQHYVSISDRVANANLDANYSTLDRRQKQLEGFINGATEDGRGDAPEVRQWQDERAKNQTALVSNPLFKYSADQAKADNQAFTLENAAYGVGGKYRNYYLRTGDADGALRGAEAELDKMSGLSVQQRNQVLGDVMTKIRGLDAVRWQRNQDLKENADALNLRSARTGNVQPSEFETMAQMLDQNRLYGKSADVRAQALLQGSAPKLVGGGIGTAQQSVDELGKIEAEVKAHPAVAGAAGAGAATGNYGPTFTKYNQYLNTGDVQSALRLSEGLRTNAYWDVNHWRTGYGSDTVTRADGSIESVTATTQITPADAERDLQRRTAIAADQAQSQIGAGQWNAMPASAKAALTSVVYNYGHVPGDIAAAATGGDKEALAGAIEAHARDNAGVNFQRRQAEAGAVRGAFGLSGPTEMAAPAGEPVRGGLTNWDEYLKNSYQLYNTHAARAWQPLKEAFDKGLQPTPAEMHEFNVLAPKITDQKLRQESLNALTVASTKDSWKTGSLAQQQEHMATLQILGQNGGLNYVERQAYEGMKAYVDQKTEMAKSNPVGYAQIYGSQDMRQTLPPINPPDFSSPDAWAADIKARQTWKGAAKADPMVGDNVMLPGDKDAMLSNMRNGSPTQIATMLNGLSAQLKPEEMSALAQDKEFRDGVMSMARDPTKMNAAYSFLDSQWRQNPLQFKALFGESAYTEMRTWQSNLSLQPDALVKKMLTASDPAQTEARDNLKKVADKALESVTEAQVVSKFNTGLPIVGAMFGATGTVAQPPLGDPGQVAPAEAMRADYMNYYREAFSQGQDASSADATATTQLKMKYAVSPANGNRVMANAPETAINPKTGTPFYPQVGGSYDWMSKQLDDEVAQALGVSQLIAPAVKRPGVGTTADPALPENMTPQQRANVREFAAPRALVPDAATEADIAAGKPPSYHVVYVRPDGRTAAMMGPDGKSLRFRFDPAPAQAELAQQAEQQRATNADSRAIGQPMSDAGYGGGL